MKLIIMKGWCKVARSPSEYICFASASYNPALQGSNSLSNASGFIPSARYNALRS